MHPINIVGIADTAEKPTDAAEREQRELAHYAEPRGGRVAVGEPTANSQWLTAFRGIASIPLKG
ncbi:MAG: hypothetical protein IJX65_00775 [Alistipes sp.]|nr:hypothetical protein [Alistipes sp.]